MRRRSFLLVVVAALAGGCSVTDTAPPYAQLYANPETHQVVSPPCRAAAPKEFAAYTLRITDADVRAAFQAWRKNQPVRPYWPDARCDAHRFTRPGSSLAGRSGGFTESRLPFQKSTRWNPDGSWNW